MAHDFWRDGRCCSSPASAWPSCFGAGIAAENRYRRPHFDCGRAIQRTPQALSGATPENECCIAPDDIHRRRPACSRPLINDTARKVSGSVSTRSGAPVRLHQAARQFYRGSRRAQRTSGERHRGRQDRRVLPVLLWAPMAAASADWYFPTQSDGSMNPTSGSTCTGSRPANRLRQTRNPKLAPADQQHRRRPNLPPIPVLMFGPFAERNVHARGGLHCSICRRSGRVDSRAPAGGMVGTLPGAARLAGHFRRAAGS